MLKIHVSFKISTLLIFIIIFEKKNSVEHLLYKFGQQQSCLRPMMSINILAISKTVYHYSNPLYLNVKNTCII